jgi:hypothetical protein
MAPPSLSSIKELLERLVIRRVRANAQCIDFRLPEHSFEFEL